MRRKEFLRKVAEIYGPDGRAVAARLIRHVGGWEVFEQNARAVFEVGAHCLPGLVYYSDIAAFAGRRRGEVARLLTFADTLAREESKDESAWAVWARFHPDYGPGELLADVLRPETRGRALTYPVWYVAERLAGLLVELTEAEEAKEGEV